MEENMLKRFKENPILSPITTHPWESYMAYNAAVLYEEGKFHIVYRAQGVKTGTSRFGYASTKDGFHIDSRLEEPIFLPDPLNDLERTVEDPRLVKIEDKIYLSYTAVGNIPRVGWGSIQIAMTSINADDFLAHRWNWGKRIYPFPGVDNKHICLFPEKINSKWVMYHRIPPHIWVAYSDDLVNWKNCSIVMQPQEEWEYLKIGGGAPPIKLDEGWLVIYHAVDANIHYRLGAALIDLNNPEKVIARTKKPILQPEEEYERKGAVPNVVFTCGASVVDDTLFLFYAGADTVVCVATCKVKELLDSMEKV
jgi:predicted GH43/DUF377 family glycosyl hydrolase